MSWRPFLTKCVTGERGEGKGILKIKIKRFFFLGSHDLLIVSLQFFSRSTLIESLEWKCTSTSRQGWVCIHKTSYELLSNFIWTSLELHMNFLWMSYELLVNFLRASCKLHMNFSQASYKLPMNILWTFYKLLANFLWTSFELNMNF